MTWPVRPSSSTWKTMRRDSVGSVMYVRARDWQWGLFYSKHSITQEFVVLNELSSNNIQKVVKRSVRKLYKGRSHLKINPVWKVVKNLMETETLIKILEHGNLCSTVQQQSKYFKVKSIKAYMYACTVVHMISAWHCVSCHMNWIKRNLQALQMHRVQSHNGSPSWWVRKNNSLSKSLLYLITS